MTEAAVIRGVVFARWVLTCFLWWLICFFDVLGVCWGFFVLFCLLVMVGFLVCFVCGLFVCLGCLFWWGWFVCLFFKKSLFCSLGVCICNPPLVGLYQWTFWNLHTCVQKNLLLFFLNAEIM